MKLARFEILHCDAGWRNFSFLKLETADGLTGVSEFNESYGSPGLGTVIRGLAEQVMGDDPRAHERIAAKLYAFTRQAPEGIACQAAAAIENALLDLKGKALGVPVYELLGGPVRDRLRLYWSHCGSYRLGEHARHTGRWAMERVSDLEKLGREVRERGFKALKTNMFLFDGTPRLHMPGFTRSPGWPELNVDDGIVAALQRAEGDGHPGVDEHPLHPHALEGCREGPDLRHEAIEVRHDLTLRLGGAGEGDPSRQQAVPHQRRFVLAQRGGLLAPGRAHEQHE